MLYNKFYTTTEYLQDLSADINYDIFPYRQDVASVETLSNMLDVGKSAIVNINVSFNYVDDDVLTANHIGVEVMKVWIVGIDSLGVAKKQSCVLSVTAKNNTYSPYRFGNAENYFFKVFLKENQKISVEFKSLDDISPITNNMCIHCGGKITDISIQ